MKYDGFTLHADMAEDLFGTVIECLEQSSSNFRLQGRHYCAIPMRFKRSINIVDSSIIQLVANCMDWAASSICDLYKARWAIEVLFKEVKKTLKIADFAGYNENAIRWQIWTALLKYMLLRFIARQSRWSHSFMRLFTVLRGVLWSCLDMFSVLECCGTAGRTSRMRAAPELAYLPGLAPGG